MVRTKNIAIIVALALSLKTVGQTLSTIKENNSEKSSANQHYDPTKNLTDLLYTVDVSKYYSFNDTNLVLEKYNGIPARNTSNPVYGQLVFDEVHNYFCYVYQHTGDGLKTAFRKSYSILKSNGVDDRNPYYDKTNFPAIVPTKSPAKGSVNNEGYDWVYPILNKFLTNKSSIHRIWYAKGHKIEAVFNNREYIIKIHPGISSEHK